VGLTALLDPYDQVILDLDGCVYLGGELISGADQAVAALHEAGRAVAFVTNDARRSPEEYVRKLWRLGVQASVHEVVTVGSALQHFLAERAEGASAYVIGSEAVFRHVADSGQRIVNGTEEENRAEVVIVAGHNDLHFRDLRPATQSVLAGAEILAAGRDRTYPTAAGISPGTGAVVAALEYATGRSARVLGKPDPQVFRTALERLPDPGAPTLVVGDRLDSDLAGALAAGLDGAIVLSGVTTSAQAEAAEPRPVAIAADLRTLVLGP
jgi:HAD superfamily hydrolase (TIGR01450 family)